MAQSLAVCTALPSSCFFHSRALCLNLKSSFKHLKVVVQGCTVVLCARRAGQLPRTKPMVRRAGEPKSRKKACGTWAYFSECGAVRKCAREVWYSLRLSGGFGRMWLLTALRSRLEGDVVRWGAFMSTEISPAVSVSQSLSLSVSQSLSLSLYIFL